MSMQVVSINVATIGNLFVNDDEGMRRIPSAYDKRGVAGAVQVRQLGIVGDEQADRNVHGGIDKAVYAYPLEHYAFWQERRQAATRRDDALPYGALAENLTMTGLTEDAVWIGDRLRIGSVLLEVTEPRQPCFKFNIRMGFAQASKLMWQSGATGFYLKVIEEGSMEAGDAIVLLPGVRNETVAEFSERRRTRRQPDLF
ncbi:MOSC domain-containing protein [Oxalicibacterium flavum]|nr:MOSC domain-containing protein [Oxalicibacterium flavum]